MSDEKELLAWLNKEVNKEPNKSSYKAGIKNKTHVDAEQNDANTNEDNELLWQQRLNVAKAIAHQVELSAEQAVPQWDRSKTFTANENSWWQWQGLPALSMACSILAIALVIFKIELVIKPEGVLLSFAGQVTQQQTSDVTALIDEKLIAFTAEQKLLLNQLSQDLLLKQQTDNYQLSAYLLNSTREERKKDLNDFMRYIDLQYKEDRLDQKIKLNQIERILFHDNSALGPNNMSKKKQLKEL